MYPAVVQYKQKKYLQIVIFMSGATNTFIDQEFLKQSKAFAVCDCFDQSFLQLAFLGIIRDKQHIKTSMSGW